MAVLDNNWPADGQCYRSFLLRCWQEADCENGEEPDQHMVWRFALSHIGRGQVMKGFSCLDDMVAYLSQELAIAGEAG